MSAEFENDVKTYGIQTVEKGAAAGSRLRMM